MKKEVTEEQKENRKYIVNNKDNNKDNKNIEMNKDVKIYMNIVSHDDMLGVLDDKD